MYGKYAQFYDLCYEAKDYQRECDFFESLIKHFSNRSVSSVLDIGCGTGRHSIPLAQKGYNVTGIDASSQMLRYAKLFARSAGVGPIFRLSRLPSILVKGKFDAAASFFAVLNYLPNENALFRALKNIRRVLHPGGVLFLDMWNPEAAIKSYTPITYREIANPSFHILRVSETKIIANKVTDQFTFFIYDKKNKKIISFKEKHVFRLYSPAQMELYLGKSGFGSVKTFSPLKINKKLRGDDFYMNIVARTI